MEDIVAPGAEGCALGADGMEDIVAPGLASCVEADGGAGISRGALAGRGGAGADDDPAAVVSLSARVLGALGALPFSLAFPFLLVATTNFIHGLEKISTGKC
jgi:hypothetical protein